MLNWVEWTAPEAAWLEDAEGAHRMARTPEGFAWGEAALGLRAHGQKLDCALTAGTAPVRRVFLRWRAALPEACTVLGDHWERGYGDMAWCGIVPERVLPWYLLIHAQGRTAGIGVQTGGGALCWWRLTQQALTLCLDVRNGDGGVCLNGRTLAAATVVTTADVPGQSAYQAARALCAALCEHPIMPAQPVYGGNNWYYAYGESTQEKLLRDAAFISSLSTHENRPYMTMDDGWQICRNSNFTGGPWHAGNRKFPDMPGMAAQMKREGTRPGIWVRPLLNCINHPAAWRLPPARMQARELGGEYAWLWDPTVPEVMATVREDIARLADWGYELIKHDYTTYDIFGRWGMAMGEEITAGDWQFNDRSVTSMEVVRALYRTIAEAAGEATVLGCNTIGHAAAGLFAINRTGDDTSGFEWSRTRKMGVNTMAFRGPQHGTFFAADADCVGITRHIPWAQNAEWLSLVAHSGTPLFVSIDPEEAGQAETHALREAFALAAQPCDDFEPLDFLHTACPSRWRLRGQERRFAWDADTPGL